MKKIILTLALALLLIGCASVADYQSNCEKVHPRFSSMTSCLKEKLKTDPRAQNGEGKILSEIYILEAEKLSRQIAKKKISEEDARLSLKKVYLELLQAEERTGTQPNPMAAALGNWMQQQSTFHQQQALQAQQYAQPTFVNTYDPNKYATPPQIRCVVNKGNTMFPQSTISCR